MSRLVLLLLTFFTLQPALAETVYKYTDEHGNTVFTDEPRQGAEVLDVQPVPTVPALPVPRSQPAAAPAPAFRYHKLQIVSPADQQQFINDPGPVVVQVATSPALRSGDKLQLLVNGTPQGEPVASRQFTLQTMDRGEHSLSVKALDPDGKDLGSSEAIRIQVKRPSLNMPTRHKPVPAKP